MQMNTMEIENHEREIMINLNMDQVQFEEYISGIMNSERVDEKEVETLLLYLVRKYRKMSGDMV